jgi:hypothetical protein
MRLFLAVGDVLFRKGGCVMKKCVKPDVSSVLSLRLPTLSERVEEHSRDGTDTLYICPDAWALRHRFVNRETGEMIRARCDSWKCLYCGPRKVDQWRQLIKAVEPTHFVTLTKVGWTVEEAARVLTTVVQRLRRGTRSKDRKGYRDAYPIEYFAVLERHKDFERVGFHWHLLIKGVEFLPNQVVSEALRSATKGRSYVTKVKAVRHNRAVGYVTKYLTKEITREEKGVREERREMIELGLDDSGNLVEVRRVELVERVSKARRIRYSRRFFPVSVAELRARLFAGLGLDGTSEIEIDDFVAEGTDPHQEQEGFSSTDGDEPSFASSSWTLLELDPFTVDVSEYRRRRREALWEALQDRQVNGRRHSRRLLTIWSYQRRELLDEQLVV